MIRTALLAGVLGMSAGCAAPVALVAAAIPVAQAGTEAYANGEMVAAVAVPLDAVAEAAAGAVVDLRFRTGTTLKTDRKAFWILRQTDGTEVTLRVDAITANVSRISVRVGFLGDQALSRMIVNQVVV